MLIAGSAASADVTRRATTPSFMSRAGGRGRSFGAEYSHIAVKVFLGSSFPRDERLGSSRTPLRLEPELVKLGVEVRSAYAEELPRVAGRAGELSGPLRMAWAAKQLAADAHVVDIAGGDGCAYFSYARARRPGQALVARSNGLWDLALAGEDPGRHGLVRGLLSHAYQKHTLCRFEQSSIRTADMAVFLSQADADEVVRRGWCASDAATAVNPAVDPSFVAHKPLSERRDVAFVGTFFHRKGSDVVVDVMSSLLAERPTLGLTLFGIGIPREQALAQFDARVRGQITVVDSLPAAELGARLGEFAVFLFPTRYEGFGIVVLEAMRAGLAVVTTPTGAGSDVVRDGENGLVVPVADRGATRAAVARLLDHPDERERLAGRAAAGASERTWRRAAEQLLHAYDRALARARSRATSDLRPRAWGV
jgi:glycosyltransferase involved in cell wall biosynthesis